MAKGEWKVQLENNIVEDCDSDSDDEYASPTYGELANLLKEYTQIIRKSKAKCDKLKDENEFLTAKYDIVVKASEEMKEENKTMSSTKNELKTSLNDATEKCEKLSEANRELKYRLVKIKEDYTKIKIDCDNLLIANELLSCDTHEAINPIVKIDVATSCDDLSKVDQSSLHDELIEKVGSHDTRELELKKYLTDATTKGKIAIQSNDVNNELAVDNERLRNEVKKFKLEKVHLATIVQKFNKGQYLQNELLKNTIMKNNKSGIGYSSFVQKKRQVNTRQNKLLSQSSAMSVEKDILPTTAKPHHQLPCQSTQDHLLSMLIMF
jgi:chromosome segregation ATPase